MFRWADGEKGELISIIGLVWLFDVWRTAVGIIPTTTKIDENWAEELP